MNTYQSLTTTLQHPSPVFSVTLVADDFLIKYKDHKSATHLLSALEQRYPLKFDWSPTQYLGIDITFNKRRRTVSLSIPAGYKPKMLRRFDPDGTGLATTSCIYTPPIKGIRNPQMVKETTSPPLDQKEKTLF